MRPSSSTTSARLRAGILPGEEQAQDQRAIGGLSAGDQRQGLVEGQDMGANVFVLAFQPALSGAQIVWVAIWYGAATSKLNRHFGRSNMAYSYKEGVSAD